MDRRRVLEFLAIAFGVSWGVALLLWVAGAEYDGALGPLVLFMWGPAIAAIAVAARRDEPIRERTGLRLGRPGWSAVGWLLPVALVGATVAVGTALPNASFTTDFASFFVEQGLSPEQAEEATAALQELPLALPVLLVVTALVAGLTVNAVAALGEELGWRGLLLDELAPLGFWRVSAITGVVWGLWHAPVVLQGHNFPAEPVAGVAVMTAATVALAPIYTYVTVRAGSVVAPTLLHGSFNALGGLALLYLTGATNLWISPVGVAGICAAALVVLACLVHDRFVADEPITTGAPLEPWSDEGAGGPADEARSAATQRAEE